ncbi:MAG: thioredoxin domain-containing protein [Actinobacteria bacterium]|nr:thioredoxin domain-containing protein [Actinomycetota bacterium]
MTTRPDNQLGSATSPYLLQHADNPVAWRPWGQSAFAEAVRRDRPVLLSVGYAACHWCHVMAHESFEDPVTAEVMNRLFVNIKVDREERPDVDRIYMDAVQAATGRGGWPMTVFLTPAGEPFYAGTYFPPEDRGGLPGFRRVLESVAEAWDHRRQEIVGHAGRISAAVAAPLPVSDETPGQEALEAAYRAIEARYDPDYGGFGGAPKFPQAPTLEFLLRITGRPWAPRAAEMLEHTLTAMADGGIYDHLGGGFARYSVDHRWLVPHFEKMLYDNALLSRLYLRAAQVTGNRDFEWIARETLDYLLADLRLPGGGFASAEDADSEGDEGRFYVFTLAELRDITGEHAPVAEAYFGATEPGNFEGSNILYRAASVAPVAAGLGITAEEAAVSIAEARRLMSAARSERVRPALDDKAVCAWNALAIRSLAEAGAVLDEPRYLEAAAVAARFLLDALRDGDGRLLRSWREGNTSGPGFADDYAATATALFVLYQATGDDSWYREAATVTRHLVGLFWDDRDGGVFATGVDAEQLIARPKNLFDNPTPSDNSMAAEALAMLAAATGEAEPARQVEEIARTAGAAVTQAPTAVAHLLAVLDSFRIGRELAIVGDPADRRTAALVAVARERFLPEVFLAVGTPDAEPVVPLLAGRGAAADGSPLAYLCSGFVCDAPTGDPAVLRAMLDRG